MDKEVSLSNIILGILNSIIKDTLLAEFTFTGDSKLKAHKLTSYPNVCGIFYAVFVFADSKDVNKYMLPTENVVRKQISAAVRHAGERVARELAKELKNSKKN